jgi:CRP-like cAMP-binding protein
VSDMNNIDFILCNEHEGYRNIKVLNRMRLLETMTYEFHPKDTLLTRPRAQSESVYFLLKGRMQVKKNASGKKGEKIDPIILEEGSIYGVVKPEEIMSVEIARRSESVVCLTNCDFVRVSVGKVTKIVIPIIIKRKLKQLFICRGLYPSRA